MCQLALLGIKGERLGVLCLESLRSIASKMIFRSHKLPFTLSLSTDHKELCFRMTTKAVLPAYVLRPVYTQRFVCFVCPTVSEHISYIRPQKLSSMRSFQGRFAPHDLSARLYQSTNRIYASLDTASQIHEALPSYDVSLVLLS